MRDIIWVGRGQQAEVSLFNDKNWIAEQIACANECVECCFTDFIDFEDGSSIEYCFALTWNGYVIVYHGLNDYTVIDEYGYLQIDEYSYVQLRERAIAIQNESIMEAANV